MATTRLAMFGITLISYSVDRGPRVTTIEMRRAASDELWSIVLMNENPMIAALARPGAVFALVELATVTQADLMGRF
jgi:hypothetical protein